MIFFVLRLLLLPIEFLYRCGFFLVTRYKWIRGRTNNFPFKIISVGNLSVGGTGKSVFVSFLIDLLGADKSAIVTRGYRGAISASGKNRIINPEQALCLTWKDAGDEACMFVQGHNVPVVVGKNRAASCVLLSAWMTQPRRKISYVVLDDSYQNNDVVKQCEILLLDARAPFDNGHCIPVGRLREKDFSRADIIILTHADMITAQAREHVKQHLLKKFNQDRIFMGAHVPLGIYEKNEQYVNAVDAASMPFVAVAGIGSFDNFFHTLKQQKLSIVSCLQYTDHYAYAVHDVENIIACVEKNMAHGIITTAKDWVKIAPLLDQISSKNKPHFFVLRIGFEFLSSQEYACFYGAIQQYLA